MKYGRHKMSRNSSRKNFSKGARSIKKINFTSGPMRGGIRL